MCQLPPSRASAAASLLFIADLPAKLKLAEGHHVILSPATGDCLKSAPGSALCSTRLPHVLMCRVFLYITVSLAGHQQVSGSSGGATLGKHRVRAGKEPSETP